MTSPDDHPAPVGRALPHESAPLHVTGRALFTEDLELSGVLHAHPVQAPHAHARVTALRTGPALLVPGVVRVLTGADVAGVNDAGDSGDEPLFPDVVQYHGQAVCWVLAEDRESARLGAAAVEVDYEPLPAVVSLAEAVAAGSFQGEAPVLRRGDVDAELAGSAVVLRGELECGGQEHFYLETQSSLAVVDESGQVLVHASTQHPTETQDVVARVLGRRSHDVTVQCLRMGGGFGGKEMQPHGYAAVAALGAVLTGRPVRVRLARAQDLVLTGKRHPFHAAWEAGLDGDGRLRALRCTLTSDGGWSLDLSQPVLTRALCHVDNAYDVAAVEVRGRIARTHKTSQTAFRGFGGPQGMLVVEEVLGRAAQVLGVPAAELRRRNLYRPGGRTPYGQVVRHAERLQDIWDRLSATSDLDGRTALVEAHNAAHEHLKRGLAITPVKFGIAFQYTAYNQAGALVHVYRDGSVLLSHGGTEMGQGLHTKMLQVCATALGVPLEAVQLAPTRTDKVPNTSATAASSGSDLNGAAVRDACEQIRARLGPVAARRLGVHTEDVRFTDGHVTGIGFTDARIPFAEVVADAYEQRVQLWAAGFYRTGGLHWDGARMQGEPFKYFAFGAAVSEVEVDGWTGAYRLLRTDILHDVGDSLSPLVDLGQVEGGFVQGLGWLTLEDLRWDTGPGPDRGQLLTRSASTYKMPGMAPAPPDFRVAFCERAAESGVVHGSKAVGEPPLMLAFSVREALRQAVAAFGPPGHVVELACPSTPEAVFWAVEAARAAGTPRVPASGGSPGTVLPSRTPS